VGLLYFKSKDGSNKNELHGRFYSISRNWIFFASTIYNKASRPSYSPQRPASAAPPHSDRVGGGEMRQYDENDWRRFCDFLSEIATNAIIKNVIPDDVDLSVMRSAIDHIEKIKAVNEGKK
jgi:hypothetical protein